MKLNKELASQMELEEQSKADAVQEVETKKKVILEL